MLRLIIPVPESAVSRIHVGAPVDVSVQALDRTFAGTVARFADKAQPRHPDDGDEVDVPNPKLELVPGMYADASITLDQAPASLVAPVQAIDRTDDDARVLVVDRDGTLEPRDVTLGLEAADRVEVRRACTPATSSSSAIARSSRPGAP